MKSLRKVLLGLAMLCLLSVLSIGALALFNEQPREAISGVPDPDALKRSPEEVAAKATPPENPRKATGGSYISKEEILAKAKDPKTLAGNMLSGREEALLMTEGEFVRRHGILTGGQINNLEIDEGKEVWIVVLGGEFEQLYRSNPGSEPYPPAKWEMYKYDATTGEILGVSSGPGEWPDAFFKDLPKN